MAEASLQDRLRNHAKAFDGLLSLIPAKMYYGEDNSDQWKKKKQTKEEAAAARRAKLDPDSELNRNAKEIMEERAKNKRKARELEREDEEEAANDGGTEEWEDYIPIEGVDAEKPGEGLKKKEPDANNKKAKVDAEDETAEPTEASSKVTRREEKKAAKKEKRKEKKSEKKESATEDAQESQDTPAAAASATRKPQKQTPKKQTPKKQAKSPAPKSEDVDIDVNVDIEMADAAPEEKEANADSSPSSESDPQSPTFDTNETSSTTATATATSEAPIEPASTTTSVSSAVPPSEKPKGIKVPSDTSALRARLAAKIEALRAARKADGPDGKPVRTRQELIEMRRHKEAKRKEHKKELRMKAKLEEQAKREEALATNSPGLMSPAVELEDPAATNFAFGRVAFDDGTQMSHDLSYVLNQNKKKGPSDPKTALLKVQNQKKRLQELDEEKRKEITEKEAWLTARRRVEGNKICDDESMLKKAIKRKEDAKSKSEKAWRERSDGVKMAQKEKQKKREENLRKRREDKMLGKAGKKKKGGVTKKKGARPGFEGSLGMGGRKK